MIFHHILIFQLDLVELSTSQGGKFRDIIFNFQETVKVSQIIYILFLLSSVIQCFSCFSFQNKLKRIMNHNL